jgi:GNAT superfamily N-acetyltransferase
MEPRKAELADLDAVASVLADAFYDDPVMRWWLRDDGRYGEALKRFFGFMMESDIPHGHVYLSQDHAAAAAWQPPAVAGQPFPVWEQIKLLPRMIQNTGLRRLTRVFKLIAMMEEHHPKRPHFYLFFLGVRDEAQGQGIGSAILSATLKVVDNARMPAYLENSNPRNTPLYVRHGFSLTAEAAPAPGAPAIQFMWREAH